MLLKQLQDFKAKRRTNDAGNMTSVAGTLSDADIEAGEATGRLLRWLDRNRAAREVAYVEPDRDELPW